MGPEIDYQANAVKKAILDKFFPRPTEPVDFQATSAGKIITLEHNGKSAQGTRDDILAAVRAATSYSNLWEILFIAGRDI